MSTELIQLPNNQQIVSNFLPLFTLESAIERRNFVAAIAKTFLKSGTDFGKVPGTDKETLFKPGAEKFTTMFGLSPRYVVAKEIEDWLGANTNGEPLFYYKIKCSLWRGDYFLGEGDGSCNSWETKYRYRWVGEDFVIANRLDETKLLKRGGRITEAQWKIDKAETTGPYGKDQSYWDQWNKAIESGKAKRVSRTNKRGEQEVAWEVEAVQYQVPNPTIPDLVNTVLKMAEKRALVAAVLVVVNASDYFTQDIEHLTPLDVSAIEVFMDAVRDEAEPFERARPEPEQQAKPTPKAAASRPDDPLKHYMDKIAANRGQGRDEVFNEFRVGLIKVFGGDEQKADDAYNNILEMNGVKKPADCKKFSQLRKLIGDFDKAVYGGTNG